MRDIRVSENRRIWDVPIEEGISVRRARQPLGLWPAAPHESPGRAVNLVSITPLLLATVVGLDQRLYLPLLCIEIEGARILRRRAWMAKLSSDSDVNPTGLLKKSAFRNDGGIGVMSPKSQAPSDDGQSIATNRFPF